MAVTEETGDIINDAVYKRNSDIEEMYNVKLNFTVREGSSESGKSSTWFSTLNVSILAGDGSIDLAGGYGYILASQSLSGNFANLCHISSIDFTAPWWADSIMDNAKIGDKLYMAIGCADPPYPKYDEAQDSYGTYLCIDNTTGFSIPIPTDAEKAVCILTSLSAHGYSDVRPEYYERVLKGKVARDEESTAMLDLVFNSVTDDFSHFYSNSFGNQGSPWMLMRMSLKENKDISSMWSKSETMYDNKMTELISALKKTAKRYVDRRDVRGVLCHLSRLDGARHSGDNTPSSRQKIRKAKTMYNFKTGIFINRWKDYESKEALINALKRAASLGIDGVQLSNMCSLDKDDSSFRKDIKNALDSLGLKVSAICGDIGIKFHDTERRAELYDTLWRIYDIALELGTNIVTTHVGVVPADKTNPRYRVMFETFSHIADHAASLDAYLANETGPETAPVLKAFLDDIGSPASAVNFDPANTVMSTGEKAEEAALTLGKYIVHTHAKDGILIKHADLEVMYGVRRDPDFRESDYCREVLLGEGDVDWKKYLAALDGIGYTGYLTIEREGSSTHDADVEREVPFLKSLISE